MREQDPEQDRIEREAVGWHVKLGRPQPDRRERAAFERWLTGDPRHGAAFERVSALWRRLEQPARRLGAGGWYRAAPAARRWAPSGLMPAAALAATLLIAITLWRDPGLVQRSLADVAAAPGAPREIHLADGSRVVLDGDSAIDVTIGPERREVRLRRGRAWFEVRSSTVAPFHVATGGVDVRVTGTAFSVERAEATGGALAVLVAQGKVAVSGEGLPQPIALGAGQGIAIGEGFPEVQSIDPDTHVAWPRGLAVFDRASLKAVAAELGRITGRRIIVVGAELEALTLSGVFRRSDPDAILAALARTMEVSVTTVPGIVTMIHR